jgi:transcriptional regulator with XRE-family HTH domain
MFSIYMSVRINNPFVNAYAHICTTMARKKQIQNPEDMPALRRLREKAGLTQSQLANRIPDKTRTKALNQSVISRWESGEDEAELTVPQVKALCRALGVPLEDLPDDFGPPGRSPASGTRLLASNTSTS